MITIDPIARSVNNNYVIRWWANDDPNQTKLKGAGVYHNLVGARLRDKHFNKVMASRDQHTTFRLPRGITIKFCAK